MSESDEKPGLSGHKAIFDKWGGCFGFGAGRKRLLIAVFPLSILIIVSIIILLLKSEDKVSILFLHSMLSETKFNNLKLRFAITYIGFIIDFKNCWGNRRWSRSSLPSMAGKKRIFQSSMCYDKS